jgi:hypothetical protein
MYTREPESQKRLLLFIIHHKATEGAVVRLFTFLGKEAAWYLLHFPVVGDALTAFSSFLTIICACTFRFVLLNNTFHILSLDIFYFHLSCAWLMNYDE